MGTGAFHLIPHQRGGGSPFDGPGLGQSDGAWAGQVRCQWPGIYATLTTSEARNDHVCRLDCTHLGGLPKCEGLSQ